MKYIPLGIVLFFFTGCFIGPVGDLVEQVEDQYFTDEFSDAPSDLDPIENTVSTKLVWESNIGNHNGSEFNLVILDEFIVAATSDGTIKKLNIENGEQVWEKNISSSIVAGIGGNFENLLVVSGDGYLWCLNQNGDVIWKTFMPGEVFVSPVIYNSEVYVRIGNYEILQLDLKQGVIQWRYKKSVPSLTLRKTSRLSFSDNVIYAGFPAAKVIAIHAESGGYLWESKISKIKGVSEIERLNDVVSKLIINNSVIYSVSTNGNISSVDRKSGRVLWTSDLSSFNDLIFDGYDIFVINKVGTIHSLRKNNGKLNWRLTDLQHRRITNGSLIKDFLVVGDFDGYIHFIDIEQGTLKGRSQMPGGVQILNNISTVNDTYMVGMDKEGNIFYFKIKVEKLLINDENVESEALVDEVLIEEAKVSLVDQVINYRYYN